MSSARRVFRPTCLTDYFLRYGLTALKPNANSHPGSHPEAAPP
jgi:hypothetical protein